MMSESMSIEELQERRGPRTIVSTDEDVRWASKCGDNRVHLGRKISRRGGSW